MNNSNNNIVQRLIWLDLEMTGLQISKDRIIEIATIITDNQLNIIAEGPVFTITQENKLLNSMDKWNTKQHTKSGLIERVNASNILEEEAENKTLEFLKKHLNETESPMCGNSIGTDRAYLKKYMPTLEKFFHYRNIDISSIKELVARWYGASVVKGCEKQMKHRALDDIKDSINELKYYRDIVFKKISLS